MGRPSRAINAMRPPGTIRAALLAGFLVIVAVWLASMFSFTSRLVEAQSESAAIHARHARGQELLFAIRSEVLLGSVYLRDAVIEAGQSPAAARTTRDRLRRLEAQVNEEIEQYRAVASLEGEPTWRRLERELRDYWDTAERLVMLPADDGIVAQRRLQTEVIPRRDGIVRLSDEIRQVIADSASGEQEELREANARVRRRIWRTTAVAVALGIAIAIMSAWHVGRLEAALRDEHEEVARNRQELRQLSGRLVRAQEDERRAIARELHDEIGQALTAVDVELAVAEGAVGAGGRAATAIHEARAVAQHALGGVRDLSQLLRPSMLDDFGLPDTLRWYLRKFSDRTGIRAELIADRLDERFPIDVEVCVYRAIQEALTNVSRHAQAGSCRVFIQCLAASVIVTVEDDGVGWQASGPAAPDRPPGLGLVGIRERAAELGGAFRIEGRGGKGTRLTIELPLPKRA